CREAVFILGAHQMLRDADRRDDLERNTQLRRRVSIVVRLAYAGPFGRRPSRSKAVLAARDRSIRNALEDVNTARNASANFPGGELDHWRCVARPARHAGSD